MDEGAERFGWSKRTAPKARREGEWFVGIGMAAAARANKMMQAKARVTLKPDGTALVETDMTDIGTGTYTILAQIAGEMLGLPSRWSTCISATPSFPAAAGSGGSFGASSSGSAVYVACQAIREALCEKMSCEAGDLTLKDGRAIAGNRAVDLGTLAGDGLAAEGEIKPGENEETYSQGSYGAHFAEVAVNAVTGEVRVRRMLGVFAAGRILNLKTARSQCIGGMTFGIGAALEEALEHDPRTGRLVNHDLAEYHVPVNADVPQIDSRLRRRARHGGQSAAIEGHRRARHLRCRRGDCQRGLQCLRRSRARLSTHAGQDPRRSAAHVMVPGKALPSLEWCLTIV